MRILFIGDARSIHTRRWVEEFSYRGHECRLMTDYPSDTPYRGVDQIYMGSPDRNKLWHYLRCVTLIKKEMIRWKPDILHAHFIAYNVGYSRKLKIGSCSGTNHQFYFFRTDASFFEQIFYRLDGTIR